MLTAFPLTEIERVVRRTVIAAIIAAIVGGAVAVVLGQPLVAPGLAVGLILAVANHRVFQASALRFTTPEGVVHRKPFAGSVALRLGVCTAVAIGSGPICLNGWAATVATGSASSSSSTRVRIAAFASGPILPSAWAA